MDPLHFSTLVESGLRTSQHLTCLSIVRLSYAVTPGLSNNVFVSRKMALFYVNRDSSIVISRLQGNTRRDVISRQHTSNGKLLRILIFIIIHRSSFPFFLFPLSSFFYDCILIPYLKFNV